MLAVLGVSVAAMGPRDTPYQRQTEAQRFLRPGRVAVEGIEDAVAVGGVAEAGAAILDLDADALRFESDGDAGRPAAVLGGVVEEVGQCSGDERRVEWELADLPL